MNAQILLRNAMVSGIQQRGENNAATEDPTSTDEGKAVMVWRKKEKEEELKFCHKIPEKKKDVATEMQKNESFGDGGEK